MLRRNRMVQIPIGLAFLIVFLLGMGAAVGLMLVVFGKRVKGG